MTAHATSTRPARAASSRRRAVAATAAYWAIEALRLVVKWLPEQWLETATRVVGDFVFFGIRWRRRVSCKRIAQAFSHLSQQQQQRLAQDSYAHLALALLWFLRLPEIVPRKHSGDDADAAIRGLVEIDAVAGAQLCCLLKRGHHQSAIVTTGHIGFWELLPPVLATSLLPPHTQWIVYRPLHNTPINTLCKQLRAGDKRHLIADKNCFRLLCNTLSSTGGSDPQSPLVGLVCDHRSNDPKTRCSVQFLGQDTFLPTGAARLHVATQAPLWFAAVVRNPAYCYHPRTVDKKPFKLLLCPIRADTKDVANLTQAYAHILEEIVQAYPSQYLWMHDLWTLRAHALVAE